VLSRISSEPKRNVGLSLTEGAIKALDELSSITGESKSEAADKAIRARLGEKKPLADEIRRLRE